MNNETKHTSGPRTVDGFHGRAEKVIQKSNHEVCVCVMPKWDGERYQELRANARLIAAAPELLEALKGVVRVADRATDEFDAARAAISKAEGR